MENNDFILTMENFIFVIDFLNLLHTRRDKGK